MKRILLLLLSLIFVISIYGQTTTFKTDLVLNKAGTVADRFYLRGSGSLLDFMTGDVVLTHSSNQLTLSGGNLSLGANSLLLTGSIGATAARVTKGWFINLEITNYPTVNGTSIATLFVPMSRTVNGYPLSGNISLTAGDVGLANVTNESKETMFATPPAASIIHIEDISIVPNIYYAAGDTSNYPIPRKIGDFYVNTTAGKLYVSKSAVRLGWVILN